ncbi:MAG: ATP-binding protein [Candidatus Omnitrophica bacterium]|nr:ATP-binding protein [Candidatus Omnitrophota bacterium]
MLPIDPDIQSQLQKEADLELGRRAFLGSFIYPLCFIAILMVSPFEKDHPFFSILFGILILILSVSRLVWTVFRRQIYAYNKQLWKNICFLIIIAIAITWGMFCGTIFAWYGIHLVSFLAILMTASISVGSFTTLCTHLGLLRMFLVLIMTPTALVGLFLGNAYAYALSFFGVIAYIFLTIQGRIHYRVYWDSIMDNALLKIRQEELKAAKQAAESANRAKSEFLATISHEIRTPLTAILGMSDALWNAPIDAPQRDYVRIIRSAGAALLGLINDILDLSKVEAGYLVLEKVDFNLRELVEKSTEMMAVRAHEKGLELILDIDPDVKLNAVGDPYRLRQVLLNLLGNAIKFTEQGEVILRVQNIREIGQEGQNRVRFSISDTGIGIDPMKKDMIFESFTQGDSSTTRRYGGTGLGLTISKKLVELMGGSMQVQSVVGRGSTVSFVLQIPVQLELEPAYDLTGAGLGPVKILIVDDNLEHGRVLKKILTSWELDVTEVSSGRKGLEELRTAKESGQPFQILLVDSVMPDMDGFKMIEQGKQEDQLQSTQIILMIPSHTRNNDLVRARELGIEVCLVKPVAQTALLEAIQKVKGAESP